jgi:hypothetical protein
MAGEFTPVTVKAAWQREHGACFRCRMGLRFELRGAVYAGGWSAHHRKPRGRGGSRNPMVSSVANCLVLCGTGTTGCHGWVERNRSLALEQGYLIPLNATTPEYEPAAVRIRSASGGWWLLTENGRAVEVESKSWV